MYKSVQIVYDCVVEEKIMEILKEVGIERYIKSPKLECEWKKDLRHLNTHIWPGTDSMIMLILETEKARELMSKVREMKKGLSQSVPLMALIIPVEEIV